MTNDQDLERAVAGSLAETIECSCCGEQVPLSSRIHQCWVIAAEELHLHGVQGLYVEGWAVHRLLSGRLEAFEHAWVELPNGSVHDQAPHNHCESEDWYFPGMRRREGPDPAGSLESFSLSLHGQTASEEELASVRRAGEEAQAFCRRENASLGP